MMKRCSALLLCLCLCFTLSSAASAASGEETSSIDVYVTDLDPGYYMCAVWDGGSLLCLFDYTVGRSGVMDTTVDIGELLPAGTRVKVGISSANAGGKQIAPIVCPVYDTYPDTGSVPDRPSNPISQSTRPPAGSYHNISTPKVTGGTVTTPANGYPGIYIPVTVTPDPGYKLARISATDSTGRDIQVPCINGQYQFYMPNCNVTLRADFVPDGSGTPPVTNTAHATLRDVYPSDYYYDSAYWAVEQGITGGLVNTIFEPKAPCSRARVVLFLWRAMGSPAPVPGTPSPFADVRPGQEHYAAIMWAMQQGIITGASPTRFDTSGSITRGQVMTMLYRAAGSPMSGGSSWFSDVPSGAYYAKAVQWAAGQGIAAGTSSTTFSPNRACTRAQIITFLYRFCGISGGVNNTAYPNTVPSAPSAPTPVITPEPVVTPEPEAPKPQGLTVGASISKVSQITGSLYTIQFQVAASAAGGTGGYEYRFEILQNGECTDSTDWSEMNAISGRLSGNGTCVVSITVKDSSGETASTTVDLLETNSIRR